MITSTCLFQPQFSQLLRAKSCILNKVFSNQFLQNPFPIPKPPWADGKALKVYQKELIEKSNCFVKFSKGIC